MDRVAMDAGICSNREQGDGEMMQTPEHYCGDNAIRAFIRRTMEDGRWRSSGDIVNKAKAIGILLSAQSAGRNMRLLTEAGYLRGVEVEKRMQWRKREGAK